MTTMTSNKPYLIRAIYDWIVDNGQTPYLLVNALAPGVQVPANHISDGRIVLNISPNACRGLHLENDNILFTARFSGEATQISVDPSAVLAIYSKENGRGMEFAEDDGDSTPPSLPPTTSSSKGARNKPALKLVR